MRLGMRLSPNYYKYLGLLRRGAFQRHPRGGWRFGTRRIADSVVARLIASGRAEDSAGQVRLVVAPEPNMTSRRLDPLNHPD